MRKILLLLCLTAFLSGCMVEVKDESISDESLPVKLHAQAKDQGVKIEAPPPNPAVACLQRFQKACLAEEWGIAYQELSSLWQENVSEQQFSQNMQQVGVEHLRGAQVISIAQVANKQQQKYLLTIMNHQRNKTQFLLIQESEIWKIAGVKNVEEKL